MNSSELIFTLACKLQNKYAVLTSLEDKKRISLIKKLLHKYHPDNPETGDAEKFIILKNELLKLQNGESLSIDKEIIPISTVPSKGHPWGDWYNR